LLNLVGCLGSIDFHKKFWLRQISYIQ